MKSACLAKRSVLYKGTTFISTYICLTRSAKEFYPAYNQYMNIKHPDTPMHVTTSALASGIFPAEEEGRSIHYWQELGLALKTDEFFDTFFRILAAESFSGMPGASQVDPYQLVNESIFGVTRIDIAVEKNTKQVLNQVMKMEGSGKAQNQ